MYIYISVYPYIFVCVLFPFASCHQRELRFGLRATALTRKGLNMQDSCMPNSLAPQAIPTGNVIGGAEVNQPDTKRWGPAHEAGEHPFHKLDWINRDDMPIGHVSMINKINPMEGYPH